MVTRWTNLIFLGGIACCLAFDRTTNPKFKLYSKLLSTTRYNPNLIPKRNISEILEVNITWEKHDLISVSEKHSVIAQSMDLNMRWMDEYLTWNPRDYGGLKEIDIKGQYVWKPVLFVPNRFDPTFMENFDDVPVVVHHDGLVMIRTTGKLNTMCTLNPQNFPFDCHDCKVNVGFLTNSKRIRFKENGRVPLMSENRHAMWDVENVSYTAGTIFPHSMVRIQVRLRRKSLYYNLNLVLPSVILSVLTMIVYIIPSDEGERISCAMTIFLSFMILPLQVSNSLPETSDSTTTMGKYYAMLMMSSLIMILASIGITRRSTCKPPECESPSATQTTWESTCKLTDCESPSDTQNTWESTCKPTDCESPSDTQNTWESTCKPSGCDSPSDTQNTISIISRKRRCVQFSKANIFQVSCAVASFVFIVVANGLYIQTYMNQVCTES